MGGTGFSDGRPREEVTRERHEVKVAVKVKAESAETADPMVGKHSPMAEKTVSTATPNVDSKQPSE